MKKLERERRWLLRKMPSVAYFNVLEITQHYMQNASENYRLRRTKDTHTGKVTYHYTKKRKIGRGLSSEIEREITEKSYRLRMYRSSKISSIRKRRHLYKTDDHVFEIDKFEDVRLIIMEIEFPTEETFVLMPKRIKSEVILEVTDIPEFSNFALSR
jgi:CYTH domain-containing protein